MVFVVTQITNWDECRGSHLIAAQYKAKKVSATELQGLVTSEAIVIDNHELADKVIERFHYERDIKKNEISLVSALELVVEDMKEESNQNANRADKFTQLRSEREESFAHSQEKVRKKFLRDELEQRALLRVTLLSEIMPVLMQQNLDNFVSGSSRSLTPTADVIKAGYQIVDEMIAQSGLDNI